MHRSRAFTLAIVALQLLAIAGCTTPTGYSQSRSTNQQPPRVHRANQHTTGTQKLRIVSVTSPVHRGSNATLVAQTVAGARCTITVYYKSGPSTAKGLYPKQADPRGRVSWTWKVGTRTTPGTWPIQVTAQWNGGSATARTSITVTD